MDSITNKLDTIVRRIEEIQDTLDKNYSQHDEFLTVDEAASIYKLAHGTLYRWKHVQVKIAGSVRISRKEMDKIIERPGKLK